jgi:hypothetical protein
VRYIISECIALLFLGMSSTILYAASPEIEAAKMYGAKGQVSFRVVDAQGKPVENARVSTGFYGNSATSDQVMEGKTDSNGFCIIAGVSASQMHYTITKDDYYATQDSYWFYPGHDRSLKDGRWQPWNPTLDVVLKEKRRPVPMFAKRYDGTIPALDTPLGFDCEKGDWVEPYGKGSRSDLIFFYTATVAGTMSFSVRLEVSVNREDGLQLLPLDRSSDFMSLYEAPENGYVSKLVFAIERTPNQIIKDHELTENQCIIFRVRTVVDSNGKMVHANYGKIYGPMSFGPAAGEHNLVFPCHFNPDGTRNLEFDPKQNLFGTSVRHRVSRP